MKDNKAKILVIRLSAMGDCAMIVPVLQRLIHSYPELQLHLLTKSFFVPIFEILPQKNLKIIAVDTNNEHKGFFGILKLSKQLKKYNFARIADLHDVLRSKIIRHYLDFPGKKTAVINKGRKEKKALTRLKNKEFKALKTTPQRYVEVFERLGFTIDLQEKLNLEKPELSTKIISLVGNSDQFWIGIAPFAAHESKIYPLDLMEKIISELDKTHKVKILLFGGGKKEVDALSKIGNQYEHVVSIAGKLTFKEELDLISHLDLMVSMDSGNGHLAALFDIPVLTLWGSTHPYAGFAPFNQPKENQFLPDLEKYPLLPLSVYGNKEISGYEDVMRTILPEGIIERIREILNF